MDSIDIKPNHSSLVERNFSHLFLLGIK